MDPVETVRLVKDALRDLRRAAHGDSNDVEINAAHALAGHVEDLLEWLDKGGFAPGGDEPPCQHSWVAGMMVVHPEDLDMVARERARHGETVECAKCEEVYRP